MIEQLGKYRIVTVLGRGGMGTVYRAFDPVLERHVALKVVSPDGRLSAEQKARLIREGKACAQLTHPNIISVYDFGDDGGHFFIVMELLQGRDLKQVIATHGTLSVAEKLSLLVQMCDGLHYAHQRQIVHRDVKPSNLFVLESGTLKILDFGLAYFAASETTGLTRTGELVGTLAYMAPERFRGIADRRADIFAVGAVSYELLTGRRAFTGDSAAQLIEMIRTEDPSPLTVVDSSLPPELSLAVQSALHKDPAARVSDLAILRSTFEAVHQRLAVAQVDGRIAPYPTRRVAEQPAPLALHDSEATPPLGKSTPPRRRATAVARLGAQFRRFGLAISVSFTVTMAVVIYLVNLQHYQSARGGGPGPTWGRGPSWEVAGPRPPLGDDGRRPGEGTGTPAPSRVEPPSAGGVDLVYAEREIRAKRAAEQRAAEQEAAARRSARSAVAKAPEGIAVARGRALAKRDEAVRAKGDDVAKDVFEGAQAKEAEAETSVRARQFANAVRLYEEAAARYGEATHQANRKFQARAEADSARARMLTQKEQASPGAPAFASGENAEKEADALYERSAFSEAAERFRSAELLYSESSRLATTDPRQAKPRPPHLPAF